MLGRQGIFILFTLTGVFVLVVPACVQHGMFMDGLQYAIVSKNMAAGKGSFWLPFLSESWNKLGETAFLEHPPLSYFLQSLFFKLFDDGVFTEKIYCLCMVALSVFLISKIWCVVFNDNQTLQRYWWLAVFLWFVTPSVFWSYRNNMIENTVSVFVLASSWLILKATLENKRVVFNLFLAGIFIFAGSLCKGVPAFFPLALVACFYFATKKISIQKLLVYSWILIATPFICYLILMSVSEEAKYSLSFYVKHRLLERVASDHTVQNRFTVLWWLLTDEFVNLAMLLLLFLFFKPRSFIVKLTNESKSWILFFSLAGLCGVVPLCLTLVQRATYFVPALPFFAMALAAFLAPRLDDLITNMKQKAFEVIRVIVVTFTVFTIALTTWSAGKDSRDEILLSDVRKIGNTVGTDVSIWTNTDIYMEWDFHFYLLRYYNATLRVSDTGEKKFLLYKKDSIPSVPAGYDRIKVDLERYVLFRKS